MDSSTVMSCEAEALATYLRLFNKIAWGRKFPLDYGTGERLHYAQIEIIENIAVKDGITMTLLSRQLGISKAAVSTVVNKLEKMGYVEKHVSEAHRGTKLLSLTAKGKVAAEGWFDYQQELQHYFEDLLQAEFEATTRFLSCFETFVDHAHEVLRQKFDIKRRPVG